MEKDYVVRSVKMGFEGTVCLEEFYKHLKKWFSQYHYDLAEMEFKELKDGKNLRIKWVADRKVSDYIQCFIEIGIAVDNIEEVEDEKKNLCSCSIEITFNALVGKDYDEKWKQGGVSKFMKEAFDKLVGKDTLTACRKELEEHVKKLKHEVTSYLNLKKA